MARARQSAHNAPTITTPQGRLTLTTATPVMTAEAAAQTTIYYTPYVGDVIPLYNGTEWQNFVFTELSIAMAASANWAADSNFDLFVYNDAGTLRLVTGAAWTNDTTRAEALVRTNGIWLNNASFTGRYGASSTVSIAASRATYVGTVRMSANGTTTWELGGTAAGGDPGKLLIWNCYNRVLAQTFTNDSTNSWSYTTTTIRGWNSSSSTNYTQFVVGLAEDVISASFLLLFTTSANAPRSGIGYDDFSNFITSSIKGLASANYAMPTVEAHFVPGIGFHTIYALERGNTGVTFYGDAGEPTLSTPGLAVRGMF